MKTKTLSFMLMIAALVTAGCSTPAMRIKHNPELFASIPPAEQELIRQGRVAIGFTPDMVRLAMGEPDIIARKTDRQGTSETWRYRGYDAHANEYAYARWGNPYWGWGGWGGRYGRWGAYYAGWVSSAPAPMTDYLRVTFREGRVSEIDQLR